MSTSQQATPRPDSESLTDTLTPATWQVNRFRLNRPHHYLGYPIAAVAATETSDDVAYLVTEHLTTLGGAVQLGAQELDLVTNITDLTPLGERIVEFALTEYSACDARGTAAREALATFATWNGKQNRFVDIAPEWTPLAQTVLLTYQPVAWLVEILQTHDGQLTLPALVEAAYDRYPAAAQTLFLRADDVGVTTTGALNPSALNDTDVYRSATTHQLKSMLWNVGILQEAGDDTSTLTPTDQQWALATDFEPQAIRPALGGEQDDR